MIDFLTFTDLDETIHAMLWDCFRMIPAVNSRWRITFSSTQIQNCHSNPTLSPILTPRRNPYCLGDIAKKRFLNSNLRLQMSNRRRQAREALLATIPETVKLIPAEVSVPPPNKRRSTVRKQENKKTKRKQQSPAPASSPALAGDIVALAATTQPSLAMSVPDPIPKITLGPKDRLILAFDVGLVSLSWAVLICTQEARGRPSVGIQYKDWIRHKGTFHWRVLTWDWTNILTENDIEYKKAKRAGEVNRSYAITDTLLRRVQPFYLNQLTDIVIEAQDNRNPVMRAVASSMLSTFQAYYRMKGVCTPETHVYTGSRKMRAIDAWREDMKPDEEEEPAAGAGEASPEASPEASLDPIAIPELPPPPPEGRLIKKLTGRRASAKPATGKKVGPRGKRSKAAYKKRKCAAVEVVEEMIALGMVTAGLTRFTEMKAVFKRRKGPNAGDDMADALLHAINRAWLICKPSIKAVPVVWDEMTYKIE